MASVLPGQLLSKRGVVRFEGYAGDQLRFQHHPMPFHSANEAVCVPQVYRQRHQGVHFVCDAFSRANCAS